ncbi:MAG: six-cysteine ranthipeptide SCIFF [Bacillota bacterium]
MAQGKATKHIRTVSEGSMKAGLGAGGCKECQASCQSACKTSCTVGNQVCRQRGN